MNGAPHWSILPKARRTLWARFASLPEHFVLYGGTALALQLGHRNSVDFDFFSAQPAEEIQSLPPVAIEPLGRIGEVGPVDWTEQTAGASGSTAPEPR